MFRGLFRLSSQAYFLKEWWRICSWNLARVFGLILEPTHAASSEPVIDNILFSFHFYIVFECMQIRGVLKALNPAQLGPQCFQRRSMACEYPPTFCISPTYSGLIHCNVIQLPVDGRIMLKYKDIWINSQFKVDTANCRLYKSL